MIPLLVLACTPGLASGTIPEETAPQWSASFSGSENSVDIATSVASSPDGSALIVTGSSDDVAGSADFVTIAYNPSTGAQLWEARYNGPVDGTDTAKAVAVSTDGSMVFVAGDSDGIESQDYATIGYDAETGTELWVARYDGDDLDAYSVGLAVSPDGSVFVTGNVWNSTTYENGSATVAYEAQTGVQRWSAVREGFAQAIAVTPDSSAVFVTGFTEDAYPRFASYAHDALTGAQLWSDSFSQGWGSAIAVSPDGATVFVTGAGSGIYFEDYTTIAYDALTGAQRCSVQYSYASWRDIPSAIAVSSDGSMVIVTGASYEDLNSYADAATVAYEASTCTERWSARYHGPLTNRPAATADAIALSPDGSKVFVAGRFWSFDERGDFATIAYDTARGTRLWAAHYQGEPASYDAAHSVAVSPSGESVFVTGRTGVGHFPDYMTIAYRASGCAAGHDEDGTISALIADALEPPTGPATPVAPYVHGVNCDIVAANGL